ASRALELATPWLCGFFFQAEDGIRDFHVTGVQTCALPISPPKPEVRRSEPKSVEPPKTNVRDKDAPTEKTKPKSHVVKVSDRRVDRKSTRLNSSHVKISYAVFCLKKKIIAAAPHRPQEGAV